MKTLLARSVLCAFLSAGSYLVADTVATVDLYKVVKSLPGLQQVQDEIQKDASLAQGKLNNKKVQLDAKIQEFESNKDTLSDQKSDKMRRDIAMLQRELKYLENDLREDLSLKEQEQKNLLIKQAVEATSIYAEKNKIDLVVPVDQVIYMNESKDITDMVIASLNLSTAKLPTENPSITSASKATPVKATETVTKSKK